MLRLQQIWRKHRRSCVELICAGLAAWCLLLAASHIGYESHTHHHTHYENESLFLIGFGRAPIIVAGEIWHFIDIIHDVLFALITVLATVAIAVFTATIWDVNRSQLRHGREIERAYVSGGGAPQFEQFDLGTETDSTRVGLSITRHRGTELRPTGRFVIMINNYGKTPADLTGIGFGFCDAKSIPPEPIYEHRYRWDQVQPGDRGRAVFPIDIPKDKPATAVYGRFYYRDIFGGHHSCGFINEIGVEMNRSDPIPAPAAYTEERDESGDGTQPNNKSFDNVSGQPQPMSVSETNRGQSAESNSSNKEPSSGERRIQGLLCLFTFGLVIVGLLQNKTLDAQRVVLEKTDNTQRAINRAIVYPDQISLIPYPDPPTVRSGWALVSNGGNTLATHATVQGGCARAKGAEKIDNPFLQLKWDDGGVNNLNIVSPKQGFPLPICDFVENEFTAAVKGDLQLFIRVIIHYRDIFDPILPRRTERTVKLLADGITSRFAYVGPNNCADNDCPDEDDR